MNQYFLPQPFTAYNPMMNFPTNNHQLGQMQIQNYGVPNLFFGCPNAFSQQIMYPNQFIPSQSVQQNYQYANFISEDTSLANLEKILLDTIPDLDGTEGNSEIKKFFKKFDATLEDWPEKKKIFALKSKLFGKAKSYFILAIKTKLYNYKLNKNFILCQLIPSEYKVEEPINLTKKTTNSKLEHLEKNCEKNEKLLPQPNNQNETNLVEKFETDLDLPVNLFEAKVEDKSEHESVGSKKGLTMDFEEAAFELPMNLFEEKAEVKFKEPEKNQVKAETIDEIVFENMVQIAKEDEPVDEDFDELRKEKANELGRMKNELELWNQENSLEIGNKNFGNFEKDLDPIIEENFKEKRKEKANELGRMKIDYEFIDQNVLEFKSKDFENFGKESVPLKEYIGKENFMESEGLIASSNFEFMRFLKFSKTRKSFIVNAKKIWKKSIEQDGNFKKNFKSNVRKQFEEYSFSMQYSILKKINSKMKLLKISVSKKINAKMKKAKKQGKFGWRKRKIRGRFFHGVRRRLCLKDMITKIRASRQFRNFLKEKRRLMQILKPKDLQFVPETKQVIQTSQMAMISLEKTRVPNKKKV
uniref:Uncharacterized protein n=1 Tax=Meloidogyne enterolobii TaxID=390850 RepID=A0A6V7WG33_MELEN|nr:unnamed protein product [Meloidogyne enterolobii]